jgi:hypothetical protein
MRRHSKLLTTAVGIAALAGWAASAQAQSNPASKNQLWGCLASKFAQSETGQMGEHSSAQSSFTPDPGDGGRRGVGNVSKEDHSDLEGGEALANGAHGDHALRNNRLLAFYPSDSGGVIGSRDLTNCPGYPGDDAP